MIKFIKNLFKKQKQEELTSQTTDPRHAKKFQGVTRPTATNYENRHPIESKFTIDVTRTSYHTRPKQIPHKKSYSGDDLFSIRGNVIRYRKSKKLTQKDVASQLGYSSTSFISNLERGDLQSIKHEDVEKLAKCLGVNIDELLLGEEKI